MLRRVRSAVRYRLQSRSLKKVVFCATTGRSGTDHVARVLDSHSGIVARHEPNPSFFGLPNIAANEGDDSICRELWLREKRSQVVRAAVDTGSQYYVETNHLFLKTFADCAVREFKGRIMVLHIRRSPVGVANSLYQLKHQPGTGTGYRWYCDFASPGNLLQIDRHLRPYGDFHHDFYAALWYWFELEARVDRFRSLYPSVPVFTLPFDRISDPAAYEELLAWIGISGAVDEDECGRRVNVKPAEKLRGAIPKREASSMYEQFISLLAEENLKLPSSARFYPDGH